MQSRLLKNRKSKMRPLTKSERLLLIALGVVLAIWLSNRFIITTQAEKLNSLKSEKLELDTKIEDMNTTLKREGNIKKEWEVLHRERNEILANYFPTLDQAQIIYLLNDLMGDDRVEITDMNFSRPTSEKIGEMDVEQMGISLPFNANYDGIMSVVKRVENSPRRIIVDTLSMDRTAAADLSGNMSLKIYSLKGLAEADPNVIYIDAVNSSGEGSLFGAFGGYSDSISTSGGSTASSGGSSTVIDDSDYTKVYLLHDFENRNYSFIPSSDMIKGDASPSTISKSGKYSLRFEYNMLALDDENRAYIDLSSSDIEFKYPPDWVSMWVNAFGYSPGTLGMRLRTQGGEDIDVNISEGISWIGWSNLEAKMPADLDLYPLQLTHLYFDLPYNRDDFGVFLIDKLEANYPVNQDTVANNKPINDFYIVKAGDTVTSISQKIYGTISYKNEIMKNNSLTTRDVLPVGKVLVLVKR